MNDYQIKSQTNSIFVKKEVDINDPAVIASIITAASTMAIASDIEISKDVVTTQLLDLYQKSSDETVSNLIGLGPQYVENNIGFATDFNDYTSARAAYEAQKNVFDTYYNNIAQRAMKMESQPKQM